MWRARPLQLILLVEVGEHETLADSRQAVGTRSAFRASSLGLRECFVPFASVRRARIVHLRGGLSERGRFARCRASLTWYECGSITSFSLKCARVVSPGATCRSTMFQSIAPARPAHA